MAPKSAIYMTYGKDVRCAGTREYIEERGVLLNVRDLEKNPLSVDELDEMLPHIPLKYFLNQSSQAYRKNGLENGLPDRQELLKMMAEDHTLFRRPIIKASRLIMTGCDRKMITEMLELGREREEVKENNRNRRPRHKAAASAGK